MSRPPLLEHQRFAVDWLQHVNRGLLGDEPGLGKTRTAIEAYGGRDRVLVIAPALILNSGTWQAEVAKWADRPEVFTFAPYSRLNARERTERGGTRPIARPRPEFDQPWDAVIIDEAHYIKGRKTSWTGATEQITQRADCVLAMTGTPVPNWGYELFTLLRLLHPDQAAPGRRYGSYWRWALSWFRNEPTRFQRYNLTGLRACTPACDLVNRTGTCEHYAEFIRGNLDGKFLRRERSEVLTDLPPLTETVVETPMDAAGRRAYRDLRAEWLTQVGDSQVVAWTPGSRTDLLDLVTVSPWLLNPDGPPTGGKFDQLTYDLQSRTRPVVVFAHHRQVVQACADLAQSLGRPARAVHGGNSAEENGQAVRDFLDGRVDVLVGSLSVMAEGLTLTRADTLIFVEKSHRPAVNEQAMRRVHRMGQTRPVTVLDYVTPRSLDLRKRSRLASKIEHAGHMLDAEILRELV